MTAQAVEDFKFQVNDSPQARTQKLEALRLTSVRTQLTITDNDWRSRLSDRLQVPDTTLTPNALPKLSFGVVREVDGQGDVFEFDAPKTLGTRAWVKIAEGTDFRAAYRVRILSGASYPTVGFLIYSAEGRYLGAYGATTPGDGLTVDLGWVTYEARATAADILASYPDAAYVRSNFDTGETNGGFQIASARIEDLSATVSIEDAVAAAETAAQNAIDAALAGAGSADTAAGYANEAHAWADEATGQAGASQASAVAAQSFADDADTSATASAAHASSALTSANDAGASAAAAEISRIAAQAANTSATTQAGIATTKAADASASAANALSSETLSATYAGNASTSADSAAASLQETKVARAAENEQLASRLLAMTIKTGQQSAAFTSEQTIRTTETEVQARQIDTLTVRMGNAEASVTAEQIARAAADSAEAALRVALDARVTTAESNIATNAANITTEASARASGDSANASSITSLTTTVNGNTTTISQHTTSINGMLASWGVSINSNGRVAGRVKLDGTGGTSSFDIEADNFSISKNGTGERMIYASNALQIFDASNVRRVLLGNLSA